MFIAIRIGEGVEQICLDASQDGFFSLPYRRGCFLLSVAAAAPAAVVMIIMIIITISSSCSNKESMRDGSRDYRVYLARALALDFVVGALLSVRV